MAQYRHNILTDKNRFISNDRNTYDYTQNRIFHK